MAAATSPLGAFMPDDIAAGYLLAGAVLLAAIAALARVVRSRYPQQQAAASLSVPLLDVEAASRAWPLRHAAQLLTASLTEDSDLRVDAFVLAGQAVCNVIEKLGPFNVILRDVRANFTKVQRAPCRAKLAQLRPLLEAERARGCHKPGKLADNSAATGLLWIIRFMRFWERLSRLALKRLDEAGGSKTRADVEIPFRPFVEVAYGEALLPYNGWVSERTFRLALAAVPKTWQLGLGELAPTAEAFWLDCDALVDALERVLQRAEGMMSALELRDVNKSM